MTYEPVVSSFIKAMAWERSTMYVEFKNGTKYAYDGVSEALYKRIKGSESIGSELTHSKITGRKL